MASVFSSVLFAFFTPPIKHCNKFKEKSLLFLKIPEILQRKYTRKHQYFQLVHFVHVIDIHENFQKAKNPELVNPTRFGRILL